jgi:hypothetical protein
MIHFSNKGFVFSLEAGLALLIFSFALITLFLPQEISLKEIYVLQQENDLLKIWSIDYPTIPQALTDCKKMFGNNFELKIDGLNVSQNISPKNNESIASSAILLDNLLNERLFEIIVYFD